MRLKSLILPKKPVLLGLALCISTISTSSVLAEVIDSQTVITAIKTLKRFQQQRIREPAEVTTDIASDIASLSAHITIFSAEIIASEEAEKILTAFRTGEHDGLPNIFEHDSQATSELFLGDYYQQLNAHLIKEMARWYGGKIPGSGGLFYQADGFRAFSPSDALWEFTDGIDIADILGTITFYVRVSSRDGQLYFLGINKMSLESYAGEHYLKHGLINNPTSGPLSSTTQIFHWQLPIPDEYRQ